MVRKNARVIVSNVATTADSTSALATRLRRRLPSSSRQPHTGPSGSTRNDWRHDSAQSNSRAASGAERYVER